MHTAVCFYINKAEGHAGHAVCWHSWKLSFVRTKRNMQLYGPSIGVPVAEPYHLIKQVYSPATRISVYLNIIISSSTCARFQLVYAERSGQCMQYI